PTPPPRTPPLSLHDALPIYLLRNERILSPHWHGRAGWDFHPLDLDAMQMAARHLIGQHDFSSFRSSQCQAASPVRIIEHLSIVQDRKSTRLNSSHVKISYAV